MFGLACSRRDPWFGSFLKFLQCFLIILDGVDFLPTALDDDAMDGDAEVHHVLDHVGDIGLLEGFGPLKRAVPKQFLGALKMPFEEIGTPR